MSMPWYSSEMIRAKDQTRQKPQIDDFCFHIQRRPQRAVIFSLDREYYWFLYQTIHNFWWKILLVILPSFAIHRTKLHDTNKFIGLQ